MDRKLVVAIVFGCMAFVGHAQTSDWKPVKLAHISLNYPSTWHLIKETRGPQTRITITPDSMQHLTMRMFELMELPTGGGHDYAYLKKNFTSMLEQSMRDGKIEKVIETTFKGHKCIYAETVASSLPGRIYGIDGGDYVYIVIVIPRRYVATADPKLERDENAILNSIAFAH